MLREGLLLTLAQANDRKAKPNRQTGENIFFCARILEENERDRSKLPNGRETPVSREKDISLLKARL